MMTTMTRQDLMAVTEGAKNKIIERLVTKYDVQAACDSARDRILNSLNSFYLENQAIMRQSNAQRDQAWRRMAALEAQIVALQQEIRTLSQTVNRMNDKIALRI
jgi:hypothetical protein